MIFKWCPLLRNLSRETCVIFSRWLLECFSSTQQLTRWIRNMDAHRDSGHLRTAPNKFQHVHNRLAGRTPGIFFVKKLFMQAGWLLDGTFSFWTRNILFNLSHRVRYRFGVNPFAKVPFFVLLFFFFTALFFYSVDEVHPSAGESQVCVSILNWFLLHCADQWLANSHPAARV
jgi:hypothetical protein